MRIHSRRWPPGKGPEPHPPREAWRSAGARQYRSLRLVVEVVAEGDHHVGTAYLESLRSDALGAATWVDPPGSAVDAALLVVEALAGWRGDSAPGGETAHRCRVCGCTDPRQQCPGGDE